MNKTELQNVLANSEKPVILDFWAPWCGPCMVTKPVLEKLAGEYSETVNFQPVNADSSRDLLEQFHISGIPTLIMIQGGSETARITGAQSEAAYRKAFESLSKGTEIKLPISPLNRMIRLGIGVTLIMYATSIQYWWIAGVGALAAFLGVYDHCPI